MTAPIGWDELDDVATRPLTPAPVFNPDRYQVRTIDLSAPAVKSLSQLRATRDYGKVLHQIRAAALTACLLLAGVLMMSIVIADALTVSGALVPSGPTGVQLIVTHDPAVEAYAHVTYADGTERDYAPGAYRGDGVVAIAFTVAADPDTPVTGCKIVIDNARVAEEIATAGQSATCRWTAS